ncbi:E3 ubiquitin-protein ligase [Panicum miliaceum]|uniref:RING-type E3 ubiquitin transferase n=1 Tax=Panicum miliaceum TaxID=4540 RepID=A0A3L6SAC8_PANMI|nr:E3 ubiquitin-protein ligase [Panicum miliaceum]
MGSLMCCLRYPDDGSAAPPGCCFCLPWPFAYHGVDSGSAARHRGDTRVAPYRGRIPLAACTSAGQVDSMDTFRAPPRPLPYDDPQFSPPIVQHPIVSERDKASTHFQKPGQIIERKNTDTASTCTSQKIDGPSVKHHSGGSRIDGIQASDSSDKYDYEDPKIALQCNHNFHLSCIYEWMERSQACPVCAKVPSFYQKIISH